MTKRAVILHVDQVKVEWRSLLGIGLAPRLSWKTCTRPVLLDLDASIDSTSPFSHSAASSLKRPRPSDPVLLVRYVVSAKLVTVAIQFCLVSCGTETKPCLGPGPEGTFNRVPGTGRYEI